MDDLDTIINQILEIDARAQQKLREAQNRRVDLQAEVEQEAVRTRNHLTESCESRIRKIYEQEKTIAEEEITAIRLQKETVIQNLETRFGKSEESWIAQITNAVTGTTR